MIDARPAVFIDKDGTLVEDVPFNVDLARLALTAHAGAALRLLARRGFALVIVSNQSGLGLGLFTDLEWDRMRFAICQALREEGVELADFQWCPHAPDLHGRPVCRCRKPSPGMLIDAASELSLDLSRSWMVGDILDDVEAGHRAGCRSVLLDVGHETQWKCGPGRVPDATVSDLLRAAHHIIDHSDARHAA